MGVTFVDSGNIILLAGLDFGSDCCSGIVALSLLFAVQFGEE